MGMNLRKVLLAVQKEEDPKRLLKVALEKVLAIAGMEAGVTFVFPVGGGRSVVAVSGLEDLAAVIKRMAVGLRTGLLFYPREAAEERGQFGCRSAMRRAGIESVLVVPLRYGGELFGYIAACSRKPRRLTRPQGETLLAIGRQVGQSLKLKREKERANGAELRLRSELHRLFNLWAFLLINLRNLLGLVSTFRMNGSPIGVDLRAALAQAEAGVSLSRLLPPEEMRLKVICHKILKGTFEALGQGCVAGSVRGDDVKLNLGAAAPSIVGGILAELATNSAKHAFPKVDEPSVTVTVRREGRLVTLTYEDNGPGRSRKRGEGQGLMTMAQLASQLPEGRIIFSWPEEPFRAVLRFEFEK